MGVDPARVDADRRWRTHVQVPDAQVGALERERELLPALLEPALGALLLVDARGELEGGAAQLELIHHGAGEGAQRGDLLGRRARAGVWSMTHNVPSAWPSGVTSGAPA